MIKVFSQRDKRSIFNSISEGPIAKGNVNSLIIGFIKFFLL